MIFGERFELAPRNVQTVLSCTETDPGFAWKSDPPGEPEYGSFGPGFSGFNFLCVLRRAVLEAITVVAGFDDMAMMGEPIQQCRAHLRIAEHIRPLQESSGWS